MSGLTNFDDPAELDRQYDIAVAVPDILTIIASQAELNAEVRASHKRYKEYAYGEAALQKLDYFPVKDRADGNAPLLVYIHGGYWHALDKDFFSVIGDAWNRVGVSVAVVNYRLAPDVKMGVLVEDVRQSIAWLWRNADELGIDRSKMVAAGSSAGGHLTAMMIATDWSGVGSDLPPQILKAGASISGLHDLEPFLQTPFLKDILRLTTEDVQSYSPARLRPPTSAPIITCVGGDETPAFHAQNKLIAERWPDVFRADIPSPGTNHITVNFELTKSDTPLFKAVQELFDI